MAATRTLTQSQLADAWGRTCYHGQKLRIVFHGGGTMSVHPVMGDAWLAFNACLVATDYPLRPRDTGGFNCRHKTGSSDLSNHGRAIAGDGNWTTNPYGGILRTDWKPETRNLIKAIRTVNGKQAFTWGGDWRGNKDAMHWEAGCGPRDYATGIDPRTVPVIGAQPVPAPAPPVASWPPPPPAPTQTPATPVLEDDMPVYLYNPRDPSEVWVTDYMDKRHAESMAEVNHAQLIGRSRGINVGPFQIDIEAFDRIPTRP